MDKINKDLFELFGLEKMPPEKGAEMVERLGKLVFQAVLVRTLPLLSEGDMSEYEQVTENDNKIEDILEFLSKKVPDLNVIIKEEAEILHDEMAKDMAEI